MSLVIFKFPYVFVSTGKSKSSLAIIIAIFKLPYVFVSIGISKRSLTISLTILILSFGLFLVELLLIHR